MGETTTQPDHEPRSPRETAIGARPRSVLRSVGVPSEHGGWSLTLEPVVLGLLVAPTSAGAALGGAALLAFVARTPLKIALVDRWRHRRLERTRVAERVAAAELVVLTALIVFAFRTAQGSFWIPLAAALPLVAVELWFDIRSRSRRLVPELAGAIGIGSVAAAIALAGAKSSAVAIGLWVVIATRVIASIPFVRLQLQRAKAKTGDVNRRGSDAAQVLAVAIVVAAAVADLVPVAGAIAITVLALFQAVANRRPPPKVPVIGAQQVALGLGVVLATALGVLAP